MHTPGIRLLSAVLLGSIPCSQNMSPAPYHSVIKDFKSQNFISRFRCECHDLYIDTGRLLPLAQQVPRKQRRWFPCKFGSVDVENHLVFVCSAYCALRGTFIAISWAQAPTLSFFSRLHDLKTIARFLKQFLEHRHTVVAYCLI